MALHIRHPRPTERGAAAVEAVLVLPIWLGLVSFILLVNVVWFNKIAVELTAMQLARHCASITKDNGETISAYTIWGCTMPLRSTLGLGVRITRTVGSDILVPQDSVRGESVLNMSVATDMGGVLTALTSLSTHSADVSVTNQLGSYGTSASMPYIERP
jgi:hypothetical protein